MEEFLVRWAWHNVHEVRPDLDKTQCMIVLAMVASEHDPKVGITLDIVYNTSKVIYPIKQVTVH